MMTHKQFFDDEDEIIDVDPASEYENWSEDNGE